MLQSSVIRVSGDSTVTSLLCDSSLANGSSTTASRTTSSHGLTARTARDSELTDSDRWHHDSPLARDEMSRHRLMTAVY